MNILLLLFSLPLYSALDILTSETISRLISAKNSLNALEEEPVTDNIAMESDQQAPSDTVLPPDMDSLNIHALLALHKLGSYLKNTHWQSQYKSLKSKVEESTVHTDTTVEATTTSGTDPPTTDTASDKPSPRLSHTTHESSHRRSDNVPQSSRKVPDTKSQSSHRPSDTVPQLPRKVPDANSQPSHQQSDSVLQSSHNVLDTKTHSSHRQPDTMSMSSNKVLDSLPQSSHRLSNVVPSYMPSDSFRNDINSQSVALLLNQHYLRNKSKQKLEVERNNEDGVRILTAKPSTTLKSEVTGIYAGPGTNFQVGSTLNFQGPKDGSDNIIYGKKAEMSVIPEATETRPQYTNPPRPEHRSEVGIELNDDPRPHRRNDPEIFEDFSSYMEMESRSGQPYLPQQFDYGYKQTYSQNFQGNGDFGKRLQPKPTPQGNGYYGRTSTKSSQYNYDTPQKSNINPLSMGMDEISSYVSSMTTLYGKDLQTQIKPPADTNVDRIGSYDTGETQDFVPHDYGYNSLQADYSNTKQPINISPHYNAPQVTQKPQNQYGGNGYQYAAPTQPKYAYPEQSPTQADYPYQTSPGPNSNEDNYYFYNNQSPPQYYDSPSTEHVDHPKQPFTPSHHTYPNYYDQIRKEKKPQRHWRPLRLNHQKHRPEGSHSEYYGNSEAGHMVVYNPPALGKKKEVKRNRLGTYLQPAVQGNQQEYTLQTSPFSIGESFQSGNVDPLASFMSALATFLPIGLLLAAIPPNIISLAANGVRGTPYLSPLLMGLHSRDCNHLVCKRGTLS